tara:strand:+ start:792 stop:1205 length:414 start_codon:yes stop_codon:yes gene_type:complete
MRIFFGLLLASLANFLAGLLGFYLATVSYIQASAPNNFESSLTFSSYFFSFLIKFLVILILTWIMHRVITMLDTPKKRILFIFLLGSAFSIYNQNDIFWLDNSAVWSLIKFLGESLNWLLTGYILSKFVRPKHLGAL